VALPSKAGDESQEMTSVESLERGAGLDRHLYLVASTGWTEGVLAGNFEARKKRACSVSEMLSGVVSGEGAALRDAARNGNDCLQTRGMDWGGGESSGNGGLRT